MPPATAVKFVTRPTLVFRGPPHVPRSLGYSGTCWRATAFLEDEETGQRVAAFMGYDGAPAIACATAKACRLRAIDGVTRCSDALLVLLPTHRRHTECSGQIFEVSNDGSVARVV